MTPREIVLANINRTESPRPGLTFDRGRIDDFLWSWVGPTGYQPKRWQEGALEFYDDEWGNVWVRMMEGSAKGEIRKPVLEDWSQLPSLRLPVYDVAECTRRIKDAFAGNPARKFKVAGIGGWIFDNARYLRKMEIYFMDMALYPDELDELHRKVISVYEKKIHAAGQAGADAICIGEDLGTQNGLLFSPAMFRRFFKPEYTRLMRLVHEYGMKILMHSCGLNWELLDDLLDCGIDCFQFDQPAVYDMPALGAKLKARRAALWAPVDIQKVLPTGDRDLIEGETRRLVDIFGGGLILKNYPDLPGIGVKPEWDQWAYDEALRYCGVHA